MAHAETLRSIVNTWECDENAHMNVQFYYAHFDTAARHFATLAGLDEDMTGPRWVRHVRYHSELRVAELILVRSAIALDGPHPLTLVHELIEPVSGRLAATAIDGYARTLDVADHPFATPLPDSAQPRSFEARAITETPDSEALLSAGAAITYRGAIHPRHCDRDGAALDQTYISAFTDGAPHAWEVGGLAARWLAENGLGRVAVEMKLSLATGLRAGDLVHMVTKYTGVARKTFTFRHHLFESRTGRLAAVGDATGVVMDLATRKAIELPERIQDHIRGMARRGG
ncbi:MAG: hypothetical protein C0606_04125 [Hyphomicrobiales bacterium]|nr:MAG: hypothetical protein C0606_04125 [Hyphomicrobiales bacterium]